MRHDSSLVFSGIAPHPPIMVPEVGHEDSREVRGSIQAMAELARRIIASGARTIVMISPHAPLDPEGFVAYNGPSLHGDFSRFRAPSLSIDVPADDQLLEEIRNVASNEDLELIDLGHANLDHGTSVPLYFLTRSGWQGKVVALGYSFRSKRDHLRFGECLRNAADAFGQPVALIASGDLSHRLKPDAPAGYDPTAYLFDEQVVAAIEANDAQRIAEIDPGLRRLAGECGYRSMLIALGATRSLPHEGEVLHYEAPFGVGYLVAQLTRKKTTAGNGRSEANERKSADSAITGHTADPADDLPRLARQIVETYTLTGAQFIPELSASPMLEVRAACFVSIRTRDGELRGCIGTIEPMKDMLADELVANATGAATRDPRFLPVVASELPNLRYSVDILSQIEPTIFEELDPKVFGVVVEDESGTKRGLLLPDIEGVETAAQQIEIAAKKAGIPQGSPLRISRFRVARYSERDD